MLSSLSPHRHGAKRNGLSIFENVKIIPQYLKEHGYYSGAFISNWTLRKKLSKLDRGFDTYTEILSIKRWLGIMNAEGKAPEVNEEVFNWLVQNSQKKIFLWVHYSEPHQPYIYHEKFDFGYSNVDPSIYPKGSHFKKIKKYDTEIGFVDFYIGELIEKLKKLRLYQDSLIIFMADHGESLGEHKYVGHGRKLYNASLHVPLLVKLPGNQNASTTIHDNTSILDIAPTLFSLMERPVPEDMEGRNLFTPQKERVLYFEAYKGAVHLNKGQGFQMRVKPVRYAILKNDLKLIFDNGFEAYNIVDDKFESQNIYKNPNPTMGEYSSLLIKYVLRVQKFLELSKKYFKQSSKLSKEDIEKLKALGYIQSKKKKSVMIPH